MRKSMWIAVFIFFVMKCYSQSINITGQEIKFITGDNKGYSSLVFDDSKWESVLLGKNWEKQGYKDYDGYAWYRIRVIIPSAIKKNVIENDGLMLSLGAIDDADETYFNGKKIGKTGGFPPEYFSKWNSKRNYRIIPEDILHDQENLIAIRVYDAHQGGGMYEGPYFLTPASWVNNIDLSIQCNADSCIFDNITPPKITMIVKNNTKKEFSGVVELVLKSDRNNELRSPPQSIEIEAGLEREIIYTPSVQNPGFYNFSVTIKKNNDTTFIRSSLIFGYEPTKIKVLPDKKPDFEIFWSETLKDLKQTNPKFHIVKSNEWSTSRLDVYLVEMKSLDNCTIRGWFTVPANKGKYKYPGLLRIPGHSVNIIPDTSIYDFAVLALNIRGHGNSQDEINPGFPGYLIYGIENKSTYIYRGAFMDCIRGIDFLCSRSEVDTSKLAVEGHSQGGALTFITAALDQRVKAAAADQPFLSDFKNYSEIVDWPRSEFQHYLNHHRSVTWEDLFTTLSYFDIKNFAKKIKCPMLMMSGLMDNICPPYTNFVAFNNLPSNFNNKNRYVIYPQALHELPSGYYRLKLEWIRSILKM